MMRKTLLTILLTVVTIAVEAECLLNDLEYTARVGYNVGGTMPLGMPASIRSLNKYKLKTNFLFGIDVNKHFSKRWGVLTGLHVEKKAMEVDATVKNYHMEMTQGNDRVEGYYTGNLVTECAEWMLTLPVLATFNINEEIMIKCGPYISFLMSKTFKGYVYDGYLRQNTPVGTKVSMGNTEDTRGTFDFSDKMRCVQVGFDIGVDWRIADHWGAYADLK